MSHRSGTSGFPQVLARAVAEGGEREAVVFRQPGIRWTWAQFGERVEALAAGFIGLGLKPGDRIGIWGPNMPEWLLTQFASARAGLILVCINPAYRLAELDYALNKVGCRALVTAERFKASDYLGMLRELAPELEQSEPGRLEAKRLPRLEMVIATGSESHDGMLRFDEWRGATVLRPSPRSKHRQGGSAGRRNQHPVHERYDRVSQGRDAHPFKPDQQ